MQQTRPTESVHTQLLTLLAERMGLELVGTRRDAALSAIRSAMADSHIESLDEYYERITAEESDLDHLIDAVSVGETYFFREPAQFDFLREHIIADIRNERGYDAPIQIWSAGCASGEEPYSIAILLEELGVAPSVQVLGTDISKSAIEQARAANYRAWSLRAADRQFIDSYFSLDGLSYQLCDRIRERAVFERHNLTTSELPAMAASEACDVIFLRNVLIYFGRDAARTLIARLASCLRVGGWLITASCDPPIQGHTELESVSSNGCVFYRRRAPGSRTYSNVRRIPGESHRAGHRKPSRRRARAKTAADAPRERFAQPAAEKALGLGDYVEVLRLTEQYPDNAVANAISIRATANLTGSLGAYRKSERACRDHPLSVELHYLRGVFLSDLGHSNDAADAFRRVIYLDPTLALAHFSLGTILAKCGDITRARRAFQTTHTICLQMDPTDVVPLTEHETASRMAFAAQAQIDALIETDSTEKGGIA